MVNHHEQKHNLGNILFQPPEANQRLIHPSLPKPVPGVSSWFLHETAMQDPTEVLLEWDKNGDQVPGQMSGVGK